MFKFGGGFKASLSFYNGKRSRSSRRREDIGSVVSITGAYRTNRDEFFGYNYPETQRKITPSIVPTNTEKPTTPLRKVKSTSDLIKNKNLPQNLLQVPEVSRDPRGAETSEPRHSKTRGNDKTKEKKLDAERIVEKKKLNEQKKLEKQRLDEQKKVEKQRMEEQKKREKLALQEQAKQEKLRKEREKKEAQQAKRDQKKKKAAPPRPIANPLGQANSSTSNIPLAQGPSNPLAGQTQYSTNTLDSSISKTSGPPPYSDVPKSKENDSTGNVTYAKPIDTGSWDIISKHRQNISRPINTGPAKQIKQTTLDLNYKANEGNENQENSEA